MRTLDEIRAQRYGVAPVNVDAAAPDKPTIPVIKNAFTALNQLADEFVMYRDRVVELNDRLATAHRERDEARERAAQWDIDRHTEKQRADRLQDRLDRRDKMMVGNVADRLERATRRIVKLTQERDAVKVELANQSDRMHGPDGPWAKIRELRSEMATLRGDLAQARRERDERYNPRQVTDYQTSEANRQARDPVLLYLVAAPLRKRIAELENTVTIMEAQALRDLERIEELNGWLDARDRAQNLAQAEVVRLREELTRERKAHVCTEQCRPNAHVAMVGRDALEHHRALLGIIRDALSSEAVSKAVGAGAHVSPGSSLRVLSDTVHEVRTMIKAAGLTVLGHEEREKIRAEWDGPTCGEQCTHTEKVSPVSPVSPES